MVSSRPDFWNRCCENYVTQGNYVRRAGEYLNLRTMFTGIVEKTALVSGVTDGPGFRRLTVALGFDDIKPGQSIAINGCCLTVAEAGRGETNFDVIKETLEKTNLGLLNPGDAVNVERSLRAGDRIDGHFVQGHVDGKATVLEVGSGAEETRVTAESPFDLAKFIVPKGSVTVDGVSLTVAAIRGNIFEVALIPTTLRLTTLGKVQRGWLLNLEADVLSKTIVSWLERREGK
jgi:riboflavin synthase